MTDPEIIQLSEDKLHRSITAIHDVSKGNEQIVKIAEAGAEKFVFKLPRNREMNFREVMACELLQHKIPVPEIIYYNDDCLVEKFVPGADLDELSLSNEDKKKVYEELGRMLHIIHSHPAEGFGNIGLDRKGKHESLKQFSPLNENNLRKLRKMYLSEREIKNLTGYFEKNDFFFNNTEKILLHYDFIDPNIRVKDKAITGIIDFGDLSSGCRALDFAWPFIAYYQQNKFQYLLNGYGAEVNMEEIKFFAACNLVWYIPWEAPSKKENINRMLGMLNDITHYRFRVRFIHYLGL